MILIYDMLIRRINIASIADMLVRIGESPKNGNGKKSREKSRFGAVSDGLQPATESRMRFSLSTPDVVVRHTLRQSNWSTPWMKPFCQELIMLSNGRGCATQ
jgi:hypothetical protein